MLSHAKNWHLNSNYLLIFKLKLVAKWNRPTHYGR